MAEDRNRMLWNLLLQKARASDVRKSSPDLEADALVEVVMKRDDALPEVPVHDASASDDPARANLPPL